jgi:predicted  nucleic acid-binding Zn-ribbon protein
MPRVTCAACGAMSDDALDGRLFRSCPKCGSTLRHAVIELEDTVEVHDRFDGKAGQPTAKKPAQRVVREILGGATFTEACRAAMIPRGSQGRYRLLLRKCFWDVLHLDRRPNTSSPTLKSAENRADRRQPVRESNLTGPSWAWNDRNPSLDRQHVDQGLKWRNQRGFGAPGRKGQKKAAPTICRGREGRYRVLTYATTCFTDSFQIV